MKITKEQSRKIRDKCWEERLVITSAGVSEVYVPYLVVCQATQTDVGFLTAGDEPKQEKDCYWRHDENEGGWVMSCSPFISRNAPNGNYCPKCGGFVVIDFYGEHTGLQREGK